MRRIMHILHHVTDRVKLDRKELHGESILYPVLRYHLFALETRYSILVSIYGKRCVTGKLANPFDMKADTRAIMYIRLCATIRIDSLVEVVSREYPDV